MKFLFRLGLFALLLGLDAALKYYTYQEIPLMSWRFPIYPYGGIAVFKNLGGVSFSLNHVENLGAAWGMFSAYSSLLLSLRIGIISCLFVFAAFINKERRKRIPLILILSGAVGNVLDFFVYGHVIDMFYFNLWGYGFPVFNLADAMISIGIFFLFVFSLGSRKKQVA